MKLNNKQELVTEVIKLKNKGLTKDQVKEVLKSSSNNYFDGYSRYNSKVYDQPYCSSYHANDVLRSFDSSNWMSKYGSITDGIYDMCSNYLDRSEVFNNEAVMTVIKKNHIEPVSILFRMSGDFNDYDVNAYYDLTKFKGIPKELVFTTKKYIGANFKPILVKFANNPKSVMLDDASGFKNYVIFNQK